MFPDRIDLAQATLVGRSGDYHTAKTRFYVTWEVRHKIYTMAGRLFISAG